MSVKSTRIYTAPVPKMPPGLVELMEGLAKDVLKYNPPDVYSFCADHMKKLIEIRDGPTPKRIMTLEQKIAIATKKIKERAARRCRDYEKETRVQAESQNAGQYTKDKIVIIPEEDLFGDVEHEIIVKIKDKTLSSESVKCTEINAEATAAETKTVDDVLSPTFSQESTNDAKDAKVENIDDSESIKEMSVMGTNEKEEIYIEIDQKDFHAEDTLESLPNDEERYLVTQGETRDIKPFINNQCLLESETSSNNCAAQDQYDIAAEMKNNKDDLNNTKEMFEVSSIVDEKNYLKDCQEKTEAAIIDSDKSTLRSLIDTEEVNTNIGIMQNTDQVSEDIFEVEQNDKSSLTLPSALSDEDDMLSANNNDLQSHVNNTSMDLETAAITIQKVFRNFLFKNKTLSTDDATNVDLNSLIEDKNEKDDNDIISNMNINKDRRTLGLGRIDTVLQTVNEEKSLSQSTDDSSTLSSAATIIQAHVRGFLIRNKFNLKNSSTTSGIDSDGLSVTSLEGDNDYRKNKTILNIHIVPESGHFISRDESVLTSIDLSLDGSPPCSTNLLPFSYERNERRKQLRREDAIQSISPPSNNSGKSEEIDSIKEILISNKNGSPLQEETGNTIADAIEIVSAATPDQNYVNFSTMNDNLGTALEVKSLGPFDSPLKYIMAERPKSLPEITSDENDVITPFTQSEEKISNDAKLIHSSEFHEVVLPTKVARSDTSVVRGE